MSHRHLRSGVWTSRVRSFATTMDRFERLTALAAAVGVAAGLLVANGIHAWLVGKGAGKTALALTDFVVVVGAVVLVRFAAEHAVYHSRPLRRLLLGRQHVEGAWINAIERQDGGASFGIVRFEPNKNSVRYGGKNYDATGLHTGDFDTDTIALRWPTLRFTYAAFDAEEAQSRAGDGFLNGFGEIRFTEREGPPTAFTGRCFDATQGMHHIEGWRIVDESIVERLDTREGRASVIREVLSRRTKPRSTGSAPPDRSAEARLKH